MSRLAPQKSLGLTKELVLVLVAVLFFTAARAQLPKHASKSPKTPSPRLPDPLENLEAIQVPTGRFGFGDSGLALKISGPKAVRM